MTNRAFLLCSLLALLAVAGCSDVESCLEVNEPGCLNSVVRTTGSPCLFDLVAVEGFCRKSANDTVDTPCGQCEAGALCDEATNTCINFCDTPTVLPGGVNPPQEIFCEALITPQMPNPAMLSFEEVCRRRCRLNCQRLSQFCTGYQCALGSCDGADVLNECQAQCPMPAAGGNDVACLTQKCNDTRFAVCDTKLSCPNGATPNCANISCSNTCMFNGKNVTGDGVCDDGDVYSSETAQCAWGTDCTDCGPRVGAEVVGGPGDVCQYSLNCAGGTGSPDSAGAWCVNLNSLPGVARCMPDCSRKQACADGFSCRTLMIPNSDGSSSPIRAGGFESSACLPDACL